MPTTKASTRNVLAFIESPILGDYSKRPIFDSLFLTKLNQGGVFMISFQRQFYHIPQSNSLLPTSHFGLARRHPALCLV